MKLKTKQKIPGQTLVMIVNIIEPVTLKTGGIRLAVLGVVGVIVLFVVRSAQSSILKIQPFFDGTTYGVHTRQGLGKFSSFFFYLIAAIVY